MTYCFAWKYSGSVFMVADSAVTGRQKPEKEYSSFGEFHPSIDDDKYVHEALLKIVPIAPGTAVAVAGDVELASAMIHHIKARFTTPSRVGELWSSLDEAFGPFDPRRSVEFLLGSTGGEDALLLHWTSDKGLNISESDYYAIGSLASFHSALTPALLSMLAKGQLQPERMLSAVLALAQSYGVHDYLLEQGVGGIFFGLRLSGQKVLWQDDTSYVLYEPSLQQVVWVSALIRGNGLVVHSSLTNEIRVFLHGGSTVCARGWGGAHLSEAKAHLQTDRYRYWIFINTQARVVTVLHRLDLEVESDRIRLKKLSENNFDLSFHPEFAALLVAPLGPGDGLGLPMRFNWLSE